MALPVYDTSQRFPGGLGYLDAEDNRVLRAQLTRQSRPLDQSPPPLMTPELPGYLPARGQRAMSGPIVQSPLPTHPAALLARPTCSRWSRHDMPNGLPRQCHWQQPRPRLLPTCLTALAAGTLPAPGHAGPR
jgi:hypothetical protein